MKNALDIKSNIWINANAGSGKTTILIKRILSLILSGAKIENIIAITYTVTAADEIKERLLKKIKTWETLEENDLIKEIIELVEMPNIASARGLFNRIISSGITISIYTIHSFCYKLLQDIAKNDKKFEPLKINTDILEGEILKTLTEETIAFIDKITLIGNEIEKESAEFFLTNIGEHNFIDFVKKIINEEQFNNNLIYNVFNIKKEQSVYSFTKNILNKTMLKNIANISEKITETEIINKWLSFNEEEKIENIEYLTSAFLITENMPRKKYSKIDNFNDIAIELANFLKTRNDLIMYNFNKLLPQIASFIRERYSVLKEQYLTYDYNDILNKTLDIISDESNIFHLYNVDYKIDHFLIDEAQDTNEKSWKIIEKLTEDFFTGKSSRDLIRTIFVVGDEKQSILSFNGVIFSLFSEKKHYFMNKSKNVQIPFLEIDLNISYRNSNEIINFVNKFCADNYIKKSITTNDNLIHIGQSDLSGNIKIIEIDNIKNNKNILQPITKNYENISIYLSKTEEIISELKDSGFKNKDITILMRNRKGKDNLMFSLFNYLSKKGIPVSGVDKININEHIIFYDFLSLFKFFLNKKDDTNLVCLLGSVFCCLKFEEIDRLCKARLENNITLYDQLKLENHNILQTLEKDIDNIIWNTEYYTYGDIGYKIASILMQKIFSIEFIGLSFAQICRKLLLLNQTISQDINNDSDCVKLSTIHGAKGTENKAIILIDSIKSIDQGIKINATDLIRIDNDNIISNIYNYKYSSIAEIIQNKKNAIKEEEMRLLYVAITRAKEQFIILTQSFSNKENKYSSFSQIIKNVLDS